jgi:hypothetical protein
MRRAILMVVATMSMLGTNAMADDFIFSFSDATGTVTGEIFGLQNNATGSATEVIITSFPASLGSIPDLIVTDWAVQVFNLFTETNGVVTDAQFFAQDDDLPFPSMFISAGIGEIITVNPNPGISGPITFAPAPVPEPSAWIFLLTVMLAVAIVKRSRRTHGLDDPATRMELSGDHEN